ncbi:MAG: 2OG-Fe(II) oxygenase [Leptolyngbya sp. Prado105]|jgi:Rps23 Pro-64 3,4-dihydroxylase Tpa1-like proline 4-hydroxylase|nr:2OG-Fe(II) oxygenase [Leptolyngbya sp. Prado105]
MSPSQTAQFAQIDNFLTPGEHSNLLKYVLDRQSDFVPTSTSTGDLDYRKSWILYHFEDYQTWMLQKVSAVIPHLLNYWNIKPFPIAQIEIQLTAHNDSNYYKVHNDNGSPDAATRTISYVYYFNREPTQFSGGTLRIYDMNVANGHYVQAESYQEIQPLNNRIVFFPSHYLHEVLPISCPSGDFADSRFTLNGWIRREAAEYV